MILSKCGNEAHPRTGVEENLLAGYVPQPRCALEGLDLCNGHVAFGDLLLGLE